MSRALLGTAAGTMLASPLLLALLAVAGTPGQPDLCQPVEATAVAGLEHEQSRNAAVIAAVGQQAGAPTYGLQVALATAMQESQLRNLPYGDRDSLG
jgi:hypothetical protein